MKKIRNKINGVLLLNKPLGISSNNAIQKVKYYLNAEKVGHTGTLDPLAQGLLPVCLGEATKFANYLLDGDKEYVATIKLGVTTDSGDAEGNVIAIQPVDTNWEQIIKATQLFIGEIEQLPPMYSALKYNGKPLYEYARAGIFVPREVRKVTIHRLEVLEFDEINHVVKIVTQVSKGTYIRVLAEDIGAKLGCGASLVGLERTKSNQFAIEDSYALESLANLAMTELKLLPIDVLCNHLPIININDSDYRYIRNGNQCCLTEFNQDIVVTDIAKEVRLYYNNVFIGVGNLQLIANKVCVHPQRMLGNLS